MRGIPSLCNALYGHNQETLCSKLIARERNVRYLARIISIGVISTGLMGCTAVRVVTHEPSTAAQDVKAGHYQVDPDHRSLIFKVGHLGFSQFVGRFDIWQAELQFDPITPENSSLSVVIDSTSLSTSSPTMNDVVGGKDMLNVTEFPEIRFNLENIALTGETTGVAHGTLTMVGKSAPVSFNITFNGGAPNPVNRIYTLGFSGNGVLNRRDFGLNAWPIAVENEVYFEIDAEFRLKSDVEKS